MGSRLADAEYFQKRAAELRKQAETARDPLLHGKYVAIASEYAALAAYLDKQQSPE